MSMIEDLIIRALQDHVTPAEREYLRRWRLRTPDNDLRYREVEALWNLTGVASPQDIQGLVPAVSSLPRLAEALSETVPAAARPAGANRGWLRRPLYSGLIAAALVAGFGLASLAQMAGSGAWAGAVDLGYSEITTGAGEMATFSLSDGTAIRIGPQSTIRVSLEDGEPVVWLSGKAFFGVQPNPNRNFKVRTEHGEAVALGTRFEVRAEQDGFHVLVVEGNVRVSAAGAAVELGDGLMSESRDGGPPSTARVEDIDRWLDWMGPTLMFRNTPLERAVAEIAARYGVDLMLGDPDLGALLITATFTDQEPERVLFVICEMIGADCTVGDNGVMRIDPKSDSPPS